MTPRINEDLPGSHLREELAERMYALLADADEFPRFAEQLADNFEFVLESASAATSDAASDVAGHFGDLEKDFQRVARIFEGLSRRPSLGKALLAEHAEKQWETTLDKSGRVVFLGRKARDLFGLAPGDLFGSVLFDAEARDAVAEAMQGRSSEPASLLPRIVAARNVTAQRVHLVIVPVIADMVALRIVPVAGAIAAPTLDGLRSTFKLTVNEIEVLKSVAEGTTLAELATSRSRSIETIRSQTKSLLKKTGTTSQLELLRMVAAIAVATSSPSKLAAPSSLVETWRDQAMIELEDGRTLQIDFHGPRLGVPVVFLHGLVTGTALSRRAIAALHDLNIRLVCPRRPGFAGSSALPSQQLWDLPIQHARDVGFLLDRLGIPAASIIGNFSGIIYALVVARELGRRVRSVVAVSGTVPIVSSAQFRGMAPWQKMFAYSSRYFPAALPILCHAAMQFFHRGEPTKLLRGLYSSPPVDAAIVDEPDVATALLSGFDSTFQQGSKAYEFDAQLTAQDWSSLLPAVSCPVSFIFGEADPVTHSEHRRHFFESNPRIRQVKIAGAGQLLLFTHSEQVISEIAKAPLEAAPSGRSGARNVT